MSLRSAGAVAAVLKDAFLEEGTKLANVVFGEVGVVIGSERRAGRGEHYLEQVPQVVLQQNTWADHSPVQKTDLVFRWNCDGSLPRGDCVAQPPCARHGFQKVSLEGTQELQAGKEKKKGT